jgi:hypothetical protein
MHQGELTLEVRWVISAVSAISAMSPVDSGKNAASQQTDVGPATDSRAAAKKQAFK